jgi:hypothetical protein
MLSDLGAIIALLMNGDKEAASAQDIWGDRPGRSVVAVTNPGESDLDTPMCVAHQHRRVSRAARAGSSRQQPRDLTLMPDRDQDPTVVRQHRSELLAMPIWTRPQPRTGAWMQPTGEHEADQS